LFALNVRAEGGAAQPAGRALEGSGGEEDEDDEELHRLKQAAMKSVLARRASMDEAS
jgi:hypothetical protein